MFLVERIALSPEPARSDGLFVRSVSVTILLPVVACSPHAWGWTAWAATHRSNAYQVDRTAVIMAVNHRLKTADGKQLVNNFRSGGLVDVVNLRAQIGKRAAGAGGVVGMTDGAAPGLEPGSWTPTGGQPFPWKLPRSLSECDSTMAGARIERPIVGRTPGA